MQNGARSNGLRRGEDLSLQRRSGPLAHEPAASRKDGNRLLHALSSPVLHRLEARVRNVTVGDTMTGLTRGMDDLHFPHQGTVISLVRETAEGAQVEVGLVGPEGFADVQAVLGPNGGRSAVSTVQASGLVSIVSTRRLRAELSTDHSTRLLLMHYAAFCMEGLMESVVCNNVHSIEQRLAKLLLTLSERIGSTDLRLSHEVLSQLLGSQRSGVTLAIGALAAAGLIAHSRKLVRIVNQTRLAERSCECHESMMRRLRDYRRHL
jgi:CRP-like cAMP-binding protein